MTQERAVFHAIAEARTRYGRVLTVNDKAVAAGQLETALGRLCPGSGRKLPPAPRDRFDGARTG